MCDDKRLLLETQFLSVWARREQYCRWPCQRVPAVWSWEGVYWRLVAEGGASSPVSHGHLPSAEPCHCHTIVLQFIFRHPVINHFRHFISFYHTFFICFKNSSEMFCLRGAFLQRYWLTCILVKRPSQLWKDPILHSLEAVIWSFFLCVNNTTS